MAFGQAMQEIRTSREASLAGEVAGFGVFAPLPRECAAVLGAAALLKREAEGTGGRSQAAGPAMPRMPEEGARKRISYGRDKRAASSTAVEAEGRDRLA